MTDMKSFPYDKLKRFVERDWAKVGSQYALIKPSGSTTVVRYFSKSEASSYFDSAPRIKTVSRKHDPATDATNETTTYSPFFKRWSKDPSIRVLSEIYTDHSTTKSRPNCLNLWNGFLIEQHPLPKTQPDLTFLLNHIKTLCGGDTEQQLYEYVLNWVAHLVQKPGEKPETYLIVSGRQGVGKGKFMELIRSIIGNDVFHSTSKYDEVFGKFNASISGKLLVVVNEGDAPNARKYKEIIKDFVDAPTLSIHEKYRPVQVCKSAHRLICVTNNYNSYGIVAKSERRPCLMYPDHHVLNRSPEEQKRYFATLAKMVASKDIQRAFFEMLKNRPLDNFNPRVACKSKFQYAREKNATPMVVRFIVGVLSDPHVKEHKYQSSVLYKRFCAWLKEEGLIYGRAQRAFSMELSSYNTDSGKMLFQKHKSGCMFYILDKPSILQYFKQQYDVSVDDESAIEVSATNWKEKYHQLEELFEMQTKEIKELKRCNAQLKALKRPGIRFVKRSVK